MLLHPAWARLLRIVARRWAGRYTVNSRSWQTPRVRPAALPATISNDFAATCSSVIIRLPMSSPARHGPRYSTGSFKHHIRLLSCRHSQRRPAAVPHLAGGWRTERAEFRAATAMGAAIATATARLRRRRRRRVTSKRPSPHTGLAPSWSAWSNLAAPAGAAARRKGTPHAPHACL